MRRLIRVSIRKSTELTEKLISQYYFHLSLIFKFSSNCVGIQPESCFNKENKCEHYGQCMAYPGGDKTECIRAKCKPTYALVCGDNGLNYASQCWMESDSFMGKTTIRVEKDQPCCKFVLLV